MGLDGWLESLEIFGSYGDELEFRFGEDQAWFGTVDWDEMSESDRARLKDLGWFESEGSASIYG